MSSKGNKITTDARARSRFPTAFATARRVTSPERAERGARDDACDEKGRARSCVHRTTTREADVETLLFEGKSTIVESSAGVDALNTKWSSSDSKTGVYFFRPV